MLLLYMAILRPGAIWGLRVSAGALNFKFWCFVLVTEDTTLA